MVISYTPVLKIPEASSTTWGFEGAQQIYVTFSCKRECQMYTVSLHFGEYTYCSTYYSSILIRGIPSSLEVQTSFPRHRTISAK